MKCLFVAFLLGATSSAMAANCNAKQAVKEYYQGPTDDRVLVAGPYSGVYHVISYAADGAKCEGGKATVNASCQVIVIEGAFCAYPENN